MNSVRFFEIQADDPKKAVEFYSAVFGWKMTKEEAYPIEYYRIKTTDMTGGILKRPTKTPPMEFGTNAYVCSMQVENFDVTAKKILELGGLEALPKFAIPGKCWQGYFLDLDNNTFGIFEVDEKAA